MPDSQPLEARTARSDTSDVPEAPEPPVAPVRRPGRPRGRQNNATLDARAFYKPKAKKLANKKIKAANAILDKYLDGKKVTDAELTFAERVSTQCAYYAFGKPKETTEISGPEGARSSPKRCRLARSKPPAGWPTSSTGPAGNHRPKGH